LELSTAAVPARSWRDGTKVRGWALSGRRKVVMGKPSDVWPFPMIAVFVGTHTSSPARKSVEHRMTSAMPPAA
jgi:hypothetical protein